MLSHILEKFLKCTVQLADADGHMLWCEWASTGPDKSLRWSCGKPAVVEVQDVDGLDFAYYCKQHKDTPPWNWETRQYVKAAVA